jgi:hypothetical protein
MKRITLKNYKKDSLYPKVVRASALALKGCNEFTVVDIMVQMGNIIPKDLVRWEKGDVPYFELIFQGSLSKANRILRILSFHTHDLNMLRDVKKVKNLNNKRFTKTGNSELERMYSVNYKWNQSNEKKGLYIQKVLENKKNT